VIKQRSFEDRLLQGNFGFPAIQWVISHRAAPEVSRKSLVIKMNPLRAATIATL